MLSGAVCAGGESGSSRCSSGSSGSSGMWGSGVGAKPGYGEGSMWKAAGVGAEMSNVRSGRDEAGSAASSVERRKVKSRPTSRSNCNQQCSERRTPSKVFRGQALTFRLCDATIRKQSSATPSGIVEA